MFLFILLVKDVVFSYSRIFFPVILDGLFGLDHFNNCLPMMKKEQLAHAFFSSPGPKGHVSFCNYFASIIISVSLSSASVNFLQLNLLLRKHGTGFNQTLQKC